LRILEIFSYDYDTTVKINVIGNNSVGQSSRNVWTALKNVFWSALNSEDVIIFGNSKAIVEINNLMHGCIEF